MPKVKKVSVTVGGTINLGNYQNAKREVTLEAELLKDEVPEDALAMLTVAGNIQFAHELIRFIEAELEGGWPRGISAEAIRQNISYNSTFQYLRRVSQVEADALLDKYVELYAAKPDPEMQRLNAELSDEHALDDDIPFADEDDDDIPDEPDGWGDEDDDDDWDDSDDEDDEPVPVGLVEGV